MTEGCNSSHIVCGLWYVALRVWWLCGFANTGDMREWKDLALRAPGFPPSSRKGVSEPRLNPSGFRVLHLYKRGVKTDLSELS